VLHESRTRLENDASAVFDKVEVSTKSTQRVGRVCEAADQVRVIGCCDLRTMQQSVAIAGWRVSPKTKFARSHRTIMYVCPEQEPAALSVLTKFQLATGLPRLAIVLRSRHFWLAAIYGEIARVMGSNMIPWSWVTAPHTGRRLMTQRVDVQSRCSSRWLVVEKSTCACALATPSAAQPFPF
jgi:hypothetical protein